MRVFEAGKRKTKGGQIDGSVMGWKIYKEDS